MAKNDNKNETEEQKIAREAVEKEAAEKKEAEEKAEKERIEKEKKDKAGKKDEDVSLPKKTLEAILARLEGQDEIIADLKTKDKKRDEEMEMLKSISDKARLARWEEQNKGSLIRTARVSFWNGSPILGWTKGKDEVGFRDGRLQVAQTIKLFLDKGEKEPIIEEVEYLYWVQNVDSESGEVVEKAERSGSNFWTMQMKDGRKITLDIRFINAF